jgi:hypothetical protein
LLTGDSFSDAPQAVSVNNRKSVIKSLINVF